MSVYEREEMLIGEEKVRLLSTRKVIVFGAGGVGGYVCEALARGGIGSITIVDNDTVSESNINRQITALHSTVGMPKTEAMKDRIADINPGIHVETHNSFYLPGKGMDFIDSGVDYIVDAVDTMSAKIGLVLEAKEKNIPIISSMGTGNKLDPTKFEIADIYETSMCPVCRIMRRELKKRGVEGLKVLYSEEKPVKPRGGGRIPASISFVPSVAGLIIAGEVIRDLAGIYSQST